MVVRTIVQVQEVAKGGALDHVTPGPLVTRVLKSMFVP